MENSRLYWCPLTLNTIMWVYELPCNKSVARCEIAKVYSQTINEFFSVAISGILLRRRAKLLKAVISESYKVGSVLLTFTLEVIMWT